MSRACVTAAVLVTTYLGLGASAKWVPHPSEKDVLTEASISDNFSVAFLNDTGYLCMFTSETASKFNTSYGNKQSCKGNVQWAETYGLKKYPECFPNMTTKDRRRDFQYALFSFDQPNKSALSPGQQDCTGWGCPLPCTKVKQALDQFGADAMQNFVVWNYVPPPPQSPPMTTITTTTTTTEPPASFNWAPYAVGVGAVMLIGAAVCCYMSQKKAPPKAKRAIKKPLVMPEPPKPAPAPAPLPVIHTTAVPVATAVPVQYVNYPPATASVSYAPVSYAAPAVSYAAPATTSVSYPAPGSISYPAGIARSPYE